MQLRLFVFSATGIMSVDWPRDEMLLNAHALALIQFETEFSMQEDERSIIHSVLASSNICAAPFVDSKAKSLVEALASLPLAITAYQEAPAGDDSNPHEEEGWTAEDVFQQYTHYKLQEKFAAGSFGEVWRALPEGAGAVWPSSSIFLLDML